LISYKFKTALHYSRKRLSIFQCVAQESQVESLVNFVKYLKEAMHRLDENALVIWYDSVTRKGSLDWQNALNEENR